MLKNISVKNISVKNISVKNISVKYISVKNCRSRKVTHSTPSKIPRSLYKNLLSFPKRHRSKNSWNINKNRFVEDNLTPFLLKVHLTAY